MADEINRTSPKTQSALLEAMEEASVTTDGVTMQIPKPFFVMATQNPIEYEGTYPLPEAQLDRFLLRVKMGYPTREEEIEVLTRSQSIPPIEELESVLTLEELLKLQEEVRTIRVDDTIRTYIVELATQTRRDPYVYLGVSPRGSIALMKAAQAYAMLKGRDYVTPDDIQYLAKFVFGHRIMLRSEARYDGITAEELTERIIAKTRVPVQRLVNQ